MPPSGYNSAACRADWADVAEIPDTQFAETDVGRIAYQVIGTGPVDVLVAHPPQFPIDLMREEPRLVRFLDGLSSFSRHIWFGPRGRGASSPVPHDVGRFQETMLEDMLGLLDALGVERVALLALSGGVSPFFAASHPERTSALVLLNPVRVLRTDDFPEGLTVEALDELLAGFFRTWGTVAEVGMSSTRMAEDDRFRRWAAKAQRLTCTSEEAEWRLRSALSFDQTGLLGTINVPTLVVARGRFPMFPPGGARDLCNRINGATYVELPGDDPLFFIGDTRPLLDAIEEFLTGDLPQHDLHRVLATVLFTDVVGSTEHAAGRRPSLDRCADRPRHHRHRRDQTSPRPPDQVHRGRSSGHLRRARTCCALRPGHHRVRPLDRH